MQIVLATSNPHKVEELSQILRELVPSVRVVGLGEVSRDPLAEPSETGTTFEANATIKALSYAQQLRERGVFVPCLADDSGLEVDALAGRPGVISSHFCTDGKEVGMSRAERDAANNQRLLRELGNLPDERRVARFVCVMVLARADRISDPVVLASARGTFEGRIGRAGDVPRGASGFGYDPLFLVAPGYAKTSAELTPAEKNAMSHRGVAARVLAGKLARM
ncbi:MAG: non-canonical purine NTP pyrophosphatase [Planctomycetota bacterium]|nr:non-canonical purine NTP pyrophosphatase [Planctomycetota bacterium]